MKLTLHVLALCLLVSIAFAEDLEYDFDSSNVVIDDSANWLTIDVEFPKQIIIDKENYEDIGKIWEDEDYIYIELILKEEHEEDTSDYTDGYFHQFK